MFEVWVLLLAAHAFGDFLLQPDVIARNKKKISWFSLHLAIHGAMTYLVLQQWDWWLIIPTVILVHGIIDFIKIRLPVSPSAFAADQAAHLLSLLGVAWLANHYGLGMNHSAYVLPPEWIILGAGFCACVWGVGYFIASIASQLYAQNPDLKEAIGQGLANGGASIGKLERTLIFILIVIGQPAGIGFLVATKSILRFEEAKKQSAAEYILIGTLWSFTLAIAISAAAIKLADHFKEL